MKVFCKAPALATPKIKTFMFRCGWTWVDSEEWGWAPYHYGRWIFRHGRWAWTPGPSTGRAVYAPALVAFFEGDLRNVSTHSDLRIGWVALGWGEPVIPWWRRSHRPWWGAGEAPGTGRLSELTGMKSSETLCSGIPA